MSRHSLQQWDHYKRQMDQLMARPDFLTNLAQSAGAMSTLVNNMLDPSVSDWSTATASGKPLLTSQEQVQFKEMLDPYVPHIRAFFNGEPIPHSGEQHGGAEELVKKMQQKLTKNMTYMGQHNVVMYGGTQIDILRQKEQQANRDPNGDVTVYVGPPPVDVPLRFITTSIVTLFDVIRMISSMVGWEKGAEILSVIVSALEVARGEWKRGITSFMGYFGTKSLWIGQVFKVFVYIFQTVPTAMHHVLLDDVTELGRTIVFGMALNIFQTISPAKIRKIFITNIDTINENNELLTQFFSDANRQKKYSYTFDPTNPRYAIYFNKYSWGDLTEFQSYMIEAKCTKEMVTFHEDLENALNEEQKREDDEQAEMKKAGKTPPPISGVGICKSLLGIMGMLPANCTKEIKPLVTHVIDLIVGQSEEGKKELLAEFTALAPAMLDVIKKAASTAALAMKPIIPSFTMPDLSGVTGAMSTAFDAVKEKTHSAFDAVKGKVGNLMPKKPNWRAQLEQLQAQVKNMEAHVSEIPTIQKLENRVKELEGQLEKTQKEEQEINMRGGSAHRNTHPKTRHNTRRIRASTRSLRQRARE